MTPERKVIFLSIGDIFIMGKVLKTNIAFKVRMIFDEQNYNRRQIVEALTCPLNRHATRVEHKCDDWELFCHPEWLINHFIENGGAKEFAKRRKEFIREIKEYEPEYYI